MKRQAAGFKMSNLVTKCFSSFCQIDKDNTLGGETALCQCSGLIGVFLLLISDLLLVF